MCGKLLILALLHLLNSARSLEVPSNDAKASIQELEDLTKLLDRALRLRSMDNARLEETTLAKRKKQEQMTTPAPQFDVVMMDGYKRAKEYAKQIHKQFMVQDLAVAIAPALVGLTAALGTGALAQDQEKLQEPK
eukprot:gnl/MRDRNA2_/MRDRNA2_62950_c0_seq1.p1 gnl/MRDRNA2_/MRDRNA2_62950_c0~~gnl/MRDRNA2_/MRDRNA2_62950_c0_seq1.p1  ORF type:complete len:135 (-),score=36.87 gnl/MRDRNA2_/MRDRNA2_62950_c0_seq1:106-510(-)